MSTSRSEEVQEHRQIKIDRAREREKSKHHAPPHSHLRRFVLPSAFFVGRAWNPAGWSFRHALRSARRRETAMPLIQPRGGDLSGVVPWKSPEKSPTASDGLREDRFVEYFSVLHDSHLKCYA